MLILNITKYIEENEKDVKMVFLGDLIKNIKYSFEFEKHDNEFYIFKDDKIKDDVI
jgi:hypothetical protein